MIAPVIAPPQVHPLHDDEGRSNFGDGNGGLNMVCRVKREQSRSRMAQYRLEKRPQAREEASLNEFIEDGKKGIAKTRKRTPKSAPAPPLPKVSRLENYSNGNILKTGVGSIAACAPPLKNLHPKNINPNPPPAHCRVMARIVVAKGLLLVPGTRLSFSQYLEWRKKGWGGLTEDNTPGNPKSFWNGHFGREEWTGTWDELASNVPPP